jgi:hypothetical protein
MTQSNTDEDELLPGDMVIRGGDDSKSYTNHVYVGHGLWLVQHRDTGTALVQLRQGCNPQYVIDNAMDGSLFTIVRGAGRRT